MSARGELWIASGGGYAGKPRPVLIIQDDAFPMTQSVTILPLTTTNLDAPLLRLAVDPAPGNGLTRPSWIEVDKITTIRRANLGQCIGRISASQMVNLERLVVTFLGMAR